MKEMKRAILLLLTAGLAACSSNDDDDDSIANQNRTLTFTSFVFETGNNPGLEFDYTCPIADGRISVVFPYMDDGAALIPSFSGNFDKVFVNGEQQMSGFTAQDFNHIVEYKLVAEDGSYRIFEVAITVAGGIPIVHLDTGDKSISTRSRYIDCNVRICNSPEYGVLEAVGGIRGRGNATWLNYPKKPYRIKLGEKVSVLGMPANKDWVLLPDYCDKSLMRSSYMFAMSELAGLPYTIRSRHVEVTLNGDYIGTYLLTEHVEEAKSRVKLSSDGFLFEADNYWYEEPLYFKTARAGINYTFKYPDADDGEIKKGDDNYNYITGFIKEFEDALFSSNFTDASTGYRKYIEAESFAKWYLVQEILGNLEPNPYYVLETRGAKLQMYPVWDAEWSLGLAARGDDFYGWALPPKTSPVKGFFWNGKQYFDRLLKDPYFVLILQSEWEKIKIGLPQLQQDMVELAATLTFTQARNFRRWPILRVHVGVGLIALGSWNAEVEYIADFFSKRTTWIDGQIQALSK